MTSTVIVDAMGGDNAPVVPVFSSLEVCNENPDVKILLVGSENLIQDTLDDAKIPENLEIIDAGESIEMGETPSLAFRNKGNSSVHVALDLLVQGKGDAFFSAGNTGAIVTAAYFKSGVIPNITRPALATSYPSVDKHKLIILDLGATLDPKAENLFDFGVLGEAYRFFMTGLEDSRISILNVGTEEKKGNKKLAEAAEMIKESILNYNGFIESNILFSHPETDVVVTDAFTGNVALKTVEGLTETISQLIKAKIAPPQLAKVQTFVFNKVFGEVFRNFQYNLYGTAFLLGINHFVGIGHGRSDKKAFKNAILRLKRYSERNFTKKIADRVKAVKS
ncbi:phosphate acyltransferase PlsX [bacterium]|nr:phosphate acyltransferase PlsX [bacterium]